MIYVTMMSVQPKKGTFVIITNLLVGGINKSRLIGRVTPGVSPGNEHSPRSLELLRGDEFVVVGRVGDIGHSGSSCCGSVDEEDGWDPMRFVPQTSQTYIAPRIPAPSPSFPLVWDVIPPRPPILSSRLHRLLIPPLHL